MRNALNAMRLRLGSPTAPHLRAGAGIAYDRRGPRHGPADEIGSLEPGKKADLIMVDIDRPHLQPYYGDYAALVYYARASDVVTSIVDGMIVVEDGRPTSLDRERTMARVREKVPGWRGKLAALGSRAGVRARVSVLRLI
jgi:5-methylthioadenosine/S-adenosylhomocysteine deaminase